MLIVDALHEVKKQDGEDILVAGMNGYARLLSAEDAGNRALDIELVTGRSSTIQDIAWHPRGNTAIMVGDGGFAMRYDSYDHSVTYVNGGVFFGENEIFVMRKRCTTNK